MMDTTPSLKPPKGSRLRGLAFMLLAKREYSRHDLQAKLLSFGANIQEVTQLLDEFAQHHYQSDQRTAEVAIRENIRKGRGPARVTQTLKHRNIDATLAQNTLTHIDWLKNAREIRTRKFGSSLPRDAKEKMRQLRFLVYRGFDHATANKAINQLCDEDA